MTSGSLDIEIRDDDVRVVLVGGGVWTLPVGPASLVENELERADRPTPEQLTNALGVVTDHFDDVTRESPLVLTPSAVQLQGPHAVQLARVELGLDDLPARYSLARADAEDVFRTLVAEPVDARSHNPGLDRESVETIIGTCCIVLAVMRRLDLAAVSIADGPDGP